MLIYIYISRGRPAIQLNLIKVYPIPDEITSWEDIIRLSMTSTDVHVSKVIRALIIGMSEERKKKERRKIE
jgi:hypothetical protein